MPRQLPSSTIRLHQLADGVRVAARTCGLWKPAGHSFEIRTSDTFLVSYPRSGNTWVRFLVGQLLSGHALDFYTLEDVIPDIYATSRGRISRIASPRVIKRHEAYRPDYPAVVYIVRDPRDVAISFYHYFRKTGGLQHSVGLRDYLLSFPDRGGESKRENWARHVRSWLDAMDSEERSYLLVRYEDLEQDSQRELDRIARFIGLQPSPHQLERAIALSSKEHMRRGEQAKARELVPKLVMRALGRDSTAFVRSGRSRQWTGVFDEELIHRYKDSFGPLMATLGYEI